MNVVDSSGWLEYLAGGTNRAHSAKLWTQDSDFAQLEGVEYVEKRSD